MELVGEAANGDEAIAICRSLQPDIALIDIRMPKLNGLETCRAIKKECPGTSVILITIHENPDYLLEALKVGAAGYLLKDITQRELLSALRQVRSGESILDKELMVRLLRRPSDRVLRRRWGCRHSILASRPASRRTRKCSRICAVVPASPRRG